MAAPGQAVLVKHIFVTLALLAACGPAAPVAAPPTQPALPTPTVLCARAKELTAANGTPMDLAECEGALTALQKDEPEQYACGAPCAKAAPTVEVMDACFTDCPAKKPKKSNPDAEGSRNVGSIETGSKNAFQQETDVSATGIGPFVHRFCPSSTKPVPATLLAAGATYTPKAEDWDTPTWRCLKFSVNEPMLYQYAYEWNGKDGVDSAYDATARRRLPNGKIRVVRLSAKGSQTGDAVRVSLTATEE